MQRDMSRQGIIRENETARLEKAMKERTYEIRLNKPARYWDDGLPIGNGRLGAMVMGKVEEETIFVNEETIWYGKDNDRRNPEALENLNKVRQLLLEGKVQQAQFLARMSMTSTPKYCNPYQPAGDLRICFYDHKHPVSDYVRALDLNSAAVTVKYRMDGYLYEREHLVSHEYQVMAIRIRAEGEKKITLSINMSRKPFEEETGKLDGATVYNRGECGSGGIHYFTGLRLAAKGGQVKTMGDFAYVEEAGEVYIYLASATDFVSPDYDALCLERLDRAEAAGYERIKEAHLADYGSLFGRMSLCIGEDADILKGKNSDALLQAVRDGGTEYEAPLAELMFHYARYLMISSSYDCVLPSNLQGIWNGEYVMLYHNT